MTLVMRQKRLADPTRFVIRQSARLDPRKITLSVALLDAAQRQQARRAENTPMNVLAFSAWCE